jgi:hypothetical protein
MANYNITISNSLNTFGLAPSDKWNDWNWNAFKWGEGTEDLQVFINLIVNTSALAPTSDMYFRFMHMLDIGSTALTSAIDAYLYTGISISNSLSITGDMLSETLMDSAGYNYVFSGQTTNAEDRFSPTYASQTANTTTWASAAASSTTWS